MESRKLKNIVLIILLITNILLLFLMISQRLASRQLQEKTMTDVVQLLEAKGISVKAEGLNKVQFPLSQSVERDQAEEQAAFTQLLGEGTAWTQRGLLTQYDGPLGQAEVWGDGGFSVSLLPGAYPLGEEEADTYSRNLLKLLHFTPFSVDSTDNVLTFTQKVSDSPVFSCQVSLAFEGECLVSIEGDRLPSQAGSSSGGDDPLSVSTLLLRFRSHIIESGDACTAILSAQEGYLMSTSASGKQNLVPVLRLETDTGLYYLDALTGEITRA